MYEVPVSIGAWLISQKAAEEDVSEEIALRLPAQRPPIAIKSESAPTPEDHGDDRPPRRKRARKQR